MSQLRPERPLPCQCCGRSFPINKLDAKPPSLAGKKATNAMLAASTEDFTVLECRDCYGPAYLEGP